MFLFCLRHLSSIAFLNVFLLQRLSSIASDDTDNNDTDHDDDEELDDKDGKDSEHEDDEDTDHDDNNDEDLDDLPPPGKKYMEIKSFPYKH
jgi:hypothetical protein